jgi:hypothetical protein
MWSGRMPQGRCGHGNAKTADQDDVPYAIGTAIDWDLTQVFDL